MRWCLCSLESPARPFHHLVPKHAMTSHSLGAPSFVSLPQRWRAQSKEPAPIGKSREQGGEELAQISGSDVLWALQRAGARKKKNKMKQEQEQRRVSSSAGTPSAMEDEIAVDYSNVRPLSINPNWATKLDDFEKRLRELSHTI